MKRTYWRVSQTAHYLEKISNNSYKYLEFCWSQFTLFNVMRFENNFLLGAAIPKGFAPRTETEGCQTTCKAIARRVLCSWNACVPLVTRREGARTRCGRPSLFAMKGDGVLSRRRIVLSADEMYVRRTSRKRDTRRAKLVKARSSGHPFPSGCASHFPPLFRPHNSFLISSSDVIFVTLAATAISASN